MKIEKTLKNKASGYHYDAGVNYLIVNQAGGAMRGEIDLRLPEIGNRIGNAEVSAASFLSENPAHIRVYALALLSAAEALEDFQIIAKS